MIATNKSHLICFQLVISTNQAVEVVRIVLSLICNEFTITVSAVSSI